MGVLNCRVRRFAGEVHGTTTSEYALLVGVVLFVAVVALSTMGIRMSDIMNTIGGKALGAASAAVESAGGSRSVTYGESSASTF